MRTGRRSGPTRSGKRRTRTGPVTVRTKNGSEKEFPDRGKIGLEMLQVRVRNDGRGGTVFFSMTGTAWRGPVRFFVSVNQAKEGRILNAAVYALLHANYAMSERSRKAAVRDLVRFWERAKAPHWNAALREAKDAVLVGEVMLS
jgi:hypothetical protein